MKYELEKKKLKCKLEKKKLENGYWQGFREDRRQSLDDICEEQKSPTKPECPLESAKLAKMRSILCEPRLSRNEAGMSFRINKTSQKVELLAIIANFKIIPHHNIVNNTNIVNF